MATLEAFGLLFDIDTGEFLLCPSLCSWEYCVLQCALVYTEQYVPCKLCTVRMYYIMYMMYY